MAKEVWFQLVQVSEDQQGILFCGVAEDAVKITDDIKDVRHLREAIREKYRHENPDILDRIAPNQLHIYANEAAYKAKVSCSPRSSLNDLGMQAILTVEVRQQQPQRPAIEIPQVDWRVTLNSQLVVRDEAQLIELSPSRIDGTGIGRSGQSLILYRRSALVKQWNEMNRCSIQTYALLWIVGPPGTGKSCAALAFAFALDRARWDVLWIHHSRRDKHFNCVRLHDNQKAICVIKEETVERDLRAILKGVSQGRQAIVFLDGYVKSSKAGEEARLKCKRWHQEDKINHRLVCVCSMATRGKDFRTCGYQPIPRRVDNRQRSPNVEMQTNADSDENEDVNRECMLDEMMFKLDSWRFEEYADAISNLRFFSSVLNMFPKSDNDLEEREKLLEAKYLVAGASARLMFDVPTVQAVQILNDAIDAAPDVELYLQGCVGDASATAINRLLARYGPDIRLVSSYVVRRFAVKLGPRLLLNFAKACAVNPSVDGYVLEACFFAELRHKGLDWSYWAESILKRERWERSNIVFFDPDKLKISVSLDDPTWMAPVKWNRAGYDAVFVNKREKLVRFVQLARPENPSFDSIYFVPLFKKLAGVLNQIAVVELYFVVPMSALESFNPPVSTRDFEASVLHASRSNVDQTLQNCHGKVMVIGVDYEINNHCQSKDPNLLSRLS